ncbi:ABC transporter permease [Candidatus Methylacidithermus pantelleriae]|uniref:Lipoprotein-releasing system permease protein n=1 Tax=Candidatus Methylacidithermus pantelleriae TaxID=2744239 RepID=A0A8J2FN47_9BACT|nr:FtsX-like permease family protein [Candidatus Methylacidithermus pantelleriae]CAF0689538.1 Lipoprotein-releasing system permease protein [Candidatus Methylacidithermus pantelleriae]
MSPVLFLALRFTYSRTRPLLLSLAGVVFGVAFFISTQAQTQGFEQFFIQTVLGTSGAIMVTDRFQPQYTTMIQGSQSELVAVSGEKPRKYYPGVYNPNLVMRVLEEFSNVASCAPVVLGNATAQTNFRSEVVRLMGIELDQHLRTTALGRQILFGSLHAFRIRPNGLMLGSLLADKLQARVGDTVYLTGTGGKIEPFRLEAIFQTGVNIIDETRAIVHARAARSLLRMPFAVSAILVKLRDPDRAPALAARLEDLVSHRCRSWQERERGNLAVFRTLRISAGITVSLIILLAGFGIFNILTLTVLQKVREIAILRSMGYRREDIRNIFLLQGLMVATVGSLLGMTLGAILTYLISKIPVRIRGIFSTDHFIVSWAWEHYLGATLIAFVAVFVASYFPAMRAANLAPVATLRGAGQ